MWWYTSEWVASWTRAMTVIGAIGLLIVFVMLGVDRLRGRRVRVVVPIKPGHHAKVASDGRRRAA